MAKIGIVHSEKKPTWTSCVSILSGLFQAYTDYFKNDEIILYDLHLRSPIGQFVQLSKQIIEDQIDKLIFINHAPNPRELLLHLNRFKKKQSLPKLYFHVYGDFTFQAREWFHSNALLHNHPTSIICASHAEQRLIDNLIQSNNPYTDYCPFPVNNDKFYYEPSIRDPSRKKYQLEEDEFTFVYTGRLSLQKNIIELCENFIKASHCHNRKMKLLLAGSFDNIGMPLFKIEFPDSYYFHLYNNFISKLSPEDQKKIVFLGQIKQEELVNLYHAADSFISLSLYHDEDYGMSPVESLCCGTPAILTDWGGYSSFFDGGNCCHLTNVSIKNDGLIIDEDDLSTQIKNVLSGDNSTNYKAKCSDYYHEHFSLLGIKKYLHAIHTKNLDLFPGFNWKLDEISKYIYQYPTQHSFYDEIYSKYISNIKQRSYPDELSL